MFKFRRANHFHRRLATLAAAVLATATLASCSSDDATDPDVIRVGVIGTYSGPVSSDAVLAKEVSEAWAESVNANGGLNGKEIKLYIEDDQGDPARSQQLLRKLVEQDQVVAIVGNATQSTDSTWPEYLEQQGVPNIGGPGASAGSLTSPMYFDTSANIIALFYGTVEAAAVNGSKLAQLYCAGNAVCASTVPLLEGLGEGLGVTVPYSSAVDPSLPDFTAICEGIADSGAESYSASIPSDVAQRVAAQCADLGVDATLISQVGSASMSGLPGFDTVQFVDARFPFFDESTEATREFHEAIEEYAPDLGSDEKPLNFLMPATWVAGKLFEAAVNAAPDGEVTSETVLEGLYALEDETLEGLTAPLNFSEGEKTLNNCYFTYQLQDGEFSTPDGLTPKCAPDEVVEATVAAMG